LAQLQRVAIAPSQLQNQQIILTAEQQHYLRTVLRLQQGDRFIAINTQGYWWLAELRSGQAHAQILKTINAQTELPVSITLMAALPKGNGFDEVVRQATELGVACIIPILSQRTLLNPSTQKLERWRRIVQEAAEQSERQIVPPVLDPITFAESLQEQSRTQPNQPLQRYLCVARQAAPHLLHCLQAAPRSAIWIATGPEGGWTAAEVEAAIAAGYQPVSLGQRILRAVTAPLAALALVAARLECDHEL
jgi:16S rRNA (uracil1498-N3)-methyltransferase